MSIQFEYFYGSQAEQFSFYRIPKMLMTSPEFKKLSDSAKLLYGLMLDRMGLSLKNGWLDDENRAYIYFTTNDVMEQMCCGRQKATKLLDALEKILYDLDVMINDVKSNYRECGNFECGEE